MADITFIAGKGDIKREEFKVFVNVGTSETPEWEIIGKKIEEMSLEMNPSIETMTDVTGDVQTTLDKYEKQTSTA